MAWTSLPASPPSASAAGYILRASSTNFNGAGVIRSSKTTDVSVSTLTVIDLIGNTTYAFQLTSLNVNGATNYFSVGSTATLADQVISPTFSGVFLSSVAVSWTVAPGAATRYIIESSTSNDFSTEISSSSSTDSQASQLTITGLSQLTTYYFRVRTFNWNNNFTTTIVGSTKTIGILLSVFIDSNTFSFGQVPQASTTVATTSITVTNNGNVAQKYWIRLTNPAGWTSVTTVPGTDEFRFRAVYSTSTPSISDFNQSDVVTTIDQTASDTQFSVDSESNAVKGFNVSPSEERGLWFMFEAPTENNVKTQQSIGITITAEAE